jgi:hypothetical protein
MTIGLSLAGLALVCAILWANLRPWWKGSRDPEQLRAFGTGGLLGAVSTMCSGGLLGWLSGCAPTAANTAGAKATQGVTGQAPGSTVTSGSLGELTPEGAVVVFLITVGTVLAWKAAGKQDKKRMAGGAFCGSCLCLTAGVAGALSFLPDLVNQAGTVLKDGVQGAGLL